jgi:hypothetical protein
VWDCKGAKADISDYVSGSVELNEHFAAFRLHSIWAKTRSGFISTRAREGVVTVHNLVTLRTTFGVHRDLWLLRHFLEYYVNLGVQQFRIVLHSTDSESPELAEAKSTLEGYGISPAAIWITRNWNTGDNAAWHRQVVADLSDDSWVISADSDEFHIFPCALREFLQILEEQRVDVVRGRLVEHVAADFRLHAPRDGISLFIQCPIAADPVYPFPGNRGKIVLHRRRVLTTPGHHSYEMAIGDSLNVYPRILTVAHFKWFLNVERKYSDVSLIAHHSASWEYSVYTQQIDRNFRGFGRIVNLLLHAPPIRELRTVCRGVRRLARHCLRCLIRTV